MKNDIDMWAQVVARSIYAAGGLGAHYGAGRLGCTVIPMSGGQTQKQVRLNPDVKHHIVVSRVYDSGST